MISNILELRADCLKKHSYLLLSKVLNYYNIPIRKSNEKNLEAKISKGKRILTLSSKKASKVNPEKLLYFVNIVLEGKISNTTKINAKNIRTDNQNGIRFELFEIKEFSLIINGESVDVSYSMLQELNKYVLNNIDKPMNLGNLNFYNQEIWNYNKCLSPLRDDSKPKIPEKILKDFIPKIIDELGHDLKQQNIESIHIDYYVETIKGLYFMVAGIKFSNKMSVDFFFKSAIPLTYYTESYSTECTIWLYLDRVKIYAESKEYKGMYNTISEFNMVPGCNPYLDFNEKFYVSAKKYFK